MEGSNRRLILNLLWWMVMIYGLLARILIEIWKYAVDNQAQRTEGEPKRHLPCANQVAEVRFIDVRKMAHNAPSGSHGFKPCQEDQCLNNRWPVNSMDMPRSFAASITS